MTTAGIAILVAILTTASIVIIIAICAMTSVTATIAVAAIIVQVVVAIALDIITDAMHEYNLAYAFTCMHGLLSCMRKKPMVMLEDVP